MKSPAVIKKFYQEKITVNAFAKIALFIIIMASSFTAVFILQQSAALTDNLVKKWGLLAELLAYNTRLCVFAESKEICSESARGLLRQEDILSVLIFTAEGRLLTNIEQPGRTMPARDEGLEKKRLEYLNKNVSDGSAHFFLEDAGAALNFWAPVILVSKASAAEALYFEEKTFPERENIIGYVEIVIDKAGLGKQLKVLLHRGFLMGVVFLMFGFAATYYAVKKITSPLEKLSAASVEISRGNLEVNVEVTSRDEIGRLSQSFNEMAADLKESERKYKELNEELALKVRERTGQLLEAQEELVRKEKLAVLGQLSGSVGHELRAPLGVMNNAVYFLKTVLSGSNEKVGEYLNIIKSEIDNSERIIADLLDFSRTRLPQARLVGVNELIGQSLAKCLIPGNVSVEMDIPAALPKIFADPFQMAQVFQNLIANGIQAMPEGGSLRVAARRVGSRELGAGSLEQRREKKTSELRTPNSELRTPNSELSADFIEISVADAGNGIARENMNKLFQPLFTTKAKGIGLGLCVSKRNVEINCGRLEVKSEPGKGTTFSVYIPVAA